MTCCLVASKSRRLLPPLPRLLPLLVVAIACLAVARGGEPQWTQWSGWSECSRTCDGGAAYQLRRCLARGGRCRGESIRYKTCNNQPCPAGSVDFREQQCTTYNDVLYKGELYQWIPYTEPRDPCSLRCEAKGHGFKLMLAPKVLDGTRCNPHSRDMCINARCMSFGCDGQLGSSARADDCGVCGGNGSTCHEADPRPPMPERKPERKQKSPFQWEEVDFSSCSVTCGVGQQRTAAICRDSRTDGRVDSLRCDPTKKPTQRVRVCEVSKCEHVWITAEWQPCTRSCGVGISRRTTYCVTELTDGTFQRAEASRCKYQRPETERACNEHECPEWVAGGWSPCSVTCGNGLQYRDVICKRTKDHGCSHDDQPETNRKCNMGVTCAWDKAPLALDNSYSAVEAKHTVSVLEKHDGKVITNERRGEVRESDKDRQRPTIKFETAPPTPHAKILPPDGTALRMTETNPRPLLQFARPEVGYVPYAEAAREAGGGEEGRDTATIDVPSLQEEDVHSGFGAGRGYLEPDGIQEAVEYASAQREKPGIREVSSTPRFVETAWSGCSVTCGDGLRHRKVVCRVFLEFSGAIQDLRDSSCDGPKPAETEVCDMGRCDDLGERKPHEMYVWRFNGYGPCSATCLSGVERAVFTCQRSRDGKPLLPELCQSVELPSVSQRVCNNVPCPPRWRPHPYGPCSAKCGGGFQRRRVECIQEMSVDVEDNIALVPDAFCPEPMPPRKTLCNIVDCPPHWSVGEWSRCSASCGGGSQQRSVACEQIVHPATVETLPDPSFCSGVDLPATQRACNQLPCPTQSSRPKGHIRSDPTSVVQLRPRSTLTMAIGGYALLLPGTSLKVRCPLKKLNRRHIVWKYRNNRVVPKKGRVKVSRGGTLRVRKTRLSDTGVYSCIASDSVANITLRFHTEREAHQRQEYRMQYSIDNAYFIKHLKNLTKKLSKRYRDRTSMSFLQSHVNVSDIPFHHVTGTWSSCSNICGGAGLQSREITCEVILNDFYLVVSDKYCNYRGLTKPIETRDCGFQLCPHWETGDWHECSDSFCMRGGQGVQMRPVACMTPQGHSVDSLRCNPDLRPNNKTECPNDKCHATWRTSEWTTCSRSCGGNGVKTRALQCVWVSNKQPAGINCRGMRRPITVKPCVAPPCSHTACRDASKFCRLIPMLHLCGHQEYQQQCCLSCSAGANSPDARQRRANGRH